MAQNTQEWILPNGLDVLGADGEKVGEVQDALGDYFVVTKGWLFPTEYYIPSTAIANVDDHAVYLTFTKDEALNQGWDHVPDTEATLDRTASETAATGVGLTDEPLVGDDPYVGTDAANADQLVDQTPVPADTTAVDDANTIRVPLSEEELTATRHTVDRGTVRIEKDVIEEERTLEVPVTEEQVHVTKHVVDREIAPDETAFEESMIEVPIRGEDIEIEKRARVTGEIEITKDAVQHTEHVSDTVRREEAHVVDDEDIVTDEGNVPVRDDDRPTH